MNFCPNLSNKKVKLEFDELISIFGENGAYLIWDRTNGNGLELAPNGADSQLFKTLLEHYKGDRKKAIIAKAKTYTDEFKRWFGDWTIPAGREITQANDVDIEGVTTIQEEGKTRYRLNGHTKEKPREFVLENIGDNKFKFHQRIWDNVDKKTPGKLSELEKNKLFRAIIEGLPVGATIVPTQSTREYLATVGTVKGRKILNRMVSTDGRFEIGKEGEFEYEENGEIKKFKTPSITKKNNVSAVVDENGEPLPVYHTNNDYFEEFTHEHSKTGARDAENAFYFSSDRDVSLWYADMFHGVNKYTRFGTNNLEKQLLDKMIDSSESVGSFREPDDEFGITVYSNGLVVQWSMWGIEEVNDIHNSEDYNILPSEMRYEIEKKITKKLPKNIDRLINDYAEISSYNKEYHRNYDPSAGVAFDTKPLSLEIRSRYFNRLFYLNIKSQEDIHDYEGLRKRTIVKYITEHTDKDGFRIVNTNDSATNILSDIYAVRDSTQIKSIDNEGEYGTTERNTYHNKNIEYLKQKYDKLLKKLEQLAKSQKRFKPGWLKEFNRENGTNFGYNPRTKLVIARGASIHGVPLTHDVESEVQPRTYMNRALLLEYLANKFNLKIREIDRYTYDQKLGNISNCCVKGDTVYIRKGDLNILTDEQLIEEFLHPVIHSIYTSNKKLSKKLLSEAKKKFPKLCKQIQYLYNEQGLDVTNEEIITQVLSKYLRKEIIDNGTNSRKLIDCIHQFIEEIIRRCSDLFGNINIQKGQTLLINGRDIRDVFNFRNLAELINSSEIRFNDTLEPSLIRDHIGNKRKQEMRARLSKIEGFKGDSYLIDSTIDYIETLGELSKEGGDSRLEKAALHFVLKGTLRFPNDIDIFEQAFDIIKKKSLDYQDYTSPNEIIDKFASSVKEKPTDPDTVKEFTNKKELEDNVVIYDVDDSFSGLMATRKVIDTHWGKNANPWCLAARKKLDTQGVLHEIQYYTDKLSKDKKALSDILKIKEASEGKDVDITKIVEYPVMLPDETGNVQEQHFFSYTWDIFMIRGEQTINGCEINVSENQIMFEVPSNIETLISQVESEILFHQDTIDDLKEKYRNQNENGSLDGAESMWRYYNGHQKQIAFKDGKLLAFNAGNDSRDQWWNRMDQPSRDIRGTYDEKYIELEYDEFGIPVGVNDIADMQPDIQPEFEPNQDEFEPNPNMHDVWIGDDTDDVDDYVDSFFEGITIGDAEDSIPQDSNKNLKEVAKVVEFLKSRFPGLKVSYINNEEDIPTWADKKAKSFVKNGRVYIITSRVTSEIAIEEMLHPFISALQHSNAALFDDLYEEAKRLFPKLYDEIQHSYSEEEGFNESDRKNELITQALSRYFLKAYRDSKGFAKYESLVEKLFNWIRQHLFRFLNKGIDPASIQDKIDKFHISNTTKLDDIASMLVYSNDTYQWEKEDKVRYNLSEEEIKEKLVDAFSTLYKAYEKINDKTKTQELLQNKIFETINKIKSLQGMQAVKEAVTFAYQELGIEDGGKRVPQGYDPKDSSTYNKNVWSYLLSLKDVGFSGVTPKIVMDLYKNYIGFYSRLIPILDNVYNDEFTRIGVGNAQRVIGEVYRLWKEAMVAVINRTIDDYIETEFSEYTDKERENMKVVFKDWALKNSFYGDISSVLKYIYNYGYSTNEIINMGFHIIQRAETKTTAESENVARYITKVFLKANSVGKKFSPAWLTIFMEFDRNGLPTGNFVRDVNYGQYEQDLNKFVSELNDEFDHDYGHHYEVDKVTGEWKNSETGISIELDEQEEWGDTGDDWTDMPTYFKYINRIEAWKCEHANRRYNYNYYKERMSRPYRGSLYGGLIGSKSSNGHGLSPRTLVKYNRIQSNINYYLDKCTDPKTGFAKPERLSKDDKLKLDIWLQELDDLSNPFNHDGTVKEDLDELNTAMEIRAWLKFINDKIDTTIFLDEFKQEEQKIKAEAAATGNWNLLNDFYKYNTRQGIHPDYMSQTIGDYIKHNGESPEVIHARMLRSGIQGLVKTTGDIEEDLKQMENFPEFWLNCQKIDQTIEDGKADSSEDFIEEMKKSFVTKIVYYRDENGNYIDNLGRTVSPADAEGREDLKTLCEYMIDAYVAKAKALGRIQGITDENGNLIDFSSKTDDEIRNHMISIFTYLHTYWNKEGVLVTKDVPLSVFNYLEPSVDLFLNKSTGKYEPTKLKVPKGSRFSRKHDWNNEYMNDEFDYSNNEAEQPKRFDEYGDKLYDNTEAFEKVMKNRDVRRLYDLLVEVMIEYSQIFNPSNKKFNYKLPQVNATNAAILSRVGSFGIKGVCKKLEESWTEVLENDEGMRTEQSFITNPDGTRSLDLPIRFVYDLKDPSTITTDITSAVKLFVNMAINYKNSAEIQPVLEMLQYGMLDVNRKENPAITEDTISDKNSVEMYKAMMEKHFYKNEWNDQPLEDVSEAKSVKDLVKDARWFTTQAAISGALTGVGAGLAATTDSLLVGAGIGGGIGALVGAGVGLSLWGLSIATNSAVARNKFIKFIHKTSALRTLGANVLSFSVGFVDSVTRIVTESLMGKYLTVRDLIGSLTYNIIRLPVYIANIGNPMPNNKLAALMHENGVSKSFNESHKRTSKGRIRNFLGNLLMGGFSITDWFSNAIVLKSFYNQVRFYRGNDFPKGFYTEYEMYKMYRQKGYSWLEAKAKAKWTHGCCWDSLFGAYQYKNGRLTIKPEFEPYVTDKVKTRIRSKTLQRIALYNGVNPDNDTPRYKTTLLGAYIGSMRGWMTQQMLHLMVGGDSVSVRLFVEDKDTSIKRGVTQSTIKRGRLSRTEEQQAERFKINHETGMPQDEVFRGLLSGTKALFAKIYGWIRGKNSRNLSDVEIYAIRDAIIYLAVLGSMLFSWPSLHKFADTFERPLNYAKVENHKEHLTKNAELAREQSSAFAPWEEGYYKYGIWAHQLDDIAFRTIESKIANISPFTMMDVVKSLTALENGFESNFSALSYIGDAVGFNKEKPTDIITKQSAYRNYQRQERDFQKTIFPLRHLHTAFSYNGVTENLRFYLNTYGKIYSLPGLNKLMDLNKKDKPSTSKPKKGKGKKKQNGPRIGGGPNIGGGPSRKGGPNIGGGPNI